jgi:hypothetical protein
MIMTDPVSDAFGHSYDKTAIELWLSEHSTSPVTGAQLPKKTLTLNHALWNIIQDFHSHAATAATATAANASIVSANAAAFFKELGSVPTILSDASGRLNSGSRKKKKALKSAHSQAELDLLNNFDWDDADKVRDMVLKSASQKVQLEVMAKTLSEVKRSLTELNRHYVLHKYWWHARDGKWRYAGAPYVYDEWNRGKWNDEWNVG